MAEDAIENKPNILLISADQLRCDAIGVYGNEIAETPNIDNLARDGIIFENHFVQNPYCMPSRWSIFTGRYPKNHGVRENGVDFNRSEMTLARALKTRGYCTAATGKMHLTSQLLAKEDEDELWPKDSFGFDTKHLTDDSKRGEYLKYLKKEDKKIYEYVLNQGKEKIDEDLSESFKRPFNLAPQIKENKIPAELHQSSWIADKTIECIKNNNNRPFFIWCSFVDPHHPFDPPEPYASMYDINDIALPARMDGEFDDKPVHFKDMYLGNSTGNERYDFSTVTDKGWKTVISKYWGMVSLIDHNIGKIIKALKDDNIYNNTIIMFTSDHGELLGDHRLLFKGPFHYDSLIKVPFIMTWASQINGGKRINKITQHTDIMPTLLDYAGVIIPRGVQGKKIRNIIDGKDTVNYEYSLIEFDTEEWGLRIKTIRSKKWRLTYYMGKKDGELYDLECDPNEFYNLWNREEYSTVKNDLIAKLLDMLIETEDQKLERQANY
jgi:arylsulfatase